MKELVIDAAHPSMQDLVEGNPIIRDVWEEKYRRNNEPDIYATFERVATAISRGRPELEEKFYEAMYLGLWMPGGRILAGAGSGNRVTLMNCYVSPDIEDNMEGIADALKAAMLTQQQGGGIGMDFSTLRPSGAYLTRTGSTASGPIPFMDMWDAMCATIMSAGSRRGAMMGTICDTHPDLPEFITAKQTKGRLTNFNVSVLVSDAFMAAVDEDADWELYFSVPPSKDRGRTIETFEDDDGVTQYVYRTIKARALWNQLLASTYVYSEPGVIFIDRINDLNNLKYCEHIHCTNPCGEQPLPANGTCNLGAVNLARMVRNPFASNASLDYDLLKEVVYRGMHFLDNVIDETLYPIEEQKLEEQQKRRTGLGVSGLADCLAQLNIRYGSGQALSCIRDIMRTICFKAYETSMQMAIDKGSFPLFEPTKFLGGFAGEKLPPELIDDINTHGIRNGVLLTIAPTGTTSLLYGDISSGIEPTFKHTGRRKVRQKNTDEWKEYTTRSYVSMLYRRVNKLGDDIDILHHENMPEHDQITVEEQVKVQGACQEWIDASVSKTVNCPETMTYDEFQAVYDLAYEKGCKGCTTYRPSDIRGSILLAAKAEERPEMLEGATYKVKWPSWSSAIYITINTFNGKPHEVFIASKDARHQEWIIAISVLISRIVRKSDDPMKILAELKQIHSTHDSAFIGKRRYGSVLGRIAEVLEEHFQKMAQMKPAEVKHSKDVCPRCLDALIMREGCAICQSCGFTKCG